MKSDFEKWYENNALDTPDAMEIYTKYPYTYVKKLEGAFNAGKISMRTKVLKILKKEYENDTFNHLEYRYHSIIRKIKQEQEEKKRMKG